MPKIKETSHQQQGDKLKILETTIQEQIVNWCRKKDILVWATPNGSKRDIREAVRLKKEGVLSGVPDLFFPELFMFMELKTQTGKLSKNQEVLIERLKNNYSVYVCRDTFEAVQIIKKHLTN